MKSNTKGKEIYLCLFNIRSTHNVGSIFRTADAAGVKKIFLVGVTPSPVDRFGRVRSDIAKVALGAEKIVPYQHFANWSKLEKELRTNGIDIICLEQSEKAVDYRKVKITRPTCLILGEEVKGIPNNILKKADKIIEIKMHGRKESLNVSVAAGIALFRIAGL